ncbi:unnamed protein product [Echinostoma caproni]|uniref:protein-L-isoaspartate(D-aspartate) O-methyltransferase n=1 Tax=Echinostoma caproni TaxID=27848 RepID=A0A183B8B8_9TREM|nr:unnamed protein product [Echinostoma caproni]
MGQEKHLLVRENGIAIGIEHIDELTNLAKSNVANWLQRADKDAVHGVVVGKNLQFITGDGRQGWKQEEPYDAIHVGAAAAKIPQAVSAARVHFCHYF